MASSSSASIKRDGEFEYDGRGPKKISQINVRLALAHLEISLSHDAFANRLLWSEPGGSPQLLDDAAIERLWLQIDLRFGFLPTKDFFATVLRDTARQNAFHPVRDYLNKLVWDGKGRVDRWLSDYGGAEYNDYTSAVGRLLLVAAVRRVRNPGVKFDEMVVLEGPQGIAQKSSAIAALCPNLSWFSDDLPLNSDSKEVIERTSGKWMVEAAELSGMGRRDVEHLKAFLSRPVDSARLAYDRATSERPRHFVVIGTTNSDTYLRDATGNRRFWPVKIRTFDLEALVRDRDQLWAEATELESQGTSIRLPRELWQEAATEQELRRLIDPWEEEIGDIVGDQVGKIPCSEVWARLGLADKAQRNQEHSARLGHVMKSLGFSRAKLRINGKPRWHYVRGSSADRQVEIKLGI